MTTVADTTDTIDITEPTTTVDPAVAERAAYIAGLRQIADWLEANPAVQLPTLNSLRPGTNEFTNMMRIYVSSYGGSARVKMAAIARAMGRAEKVFQHEDFCLVRTFAGITISAEVDRDEVCERVVVGKREVTEEVPDADALAAVPKVTVTRTVEDVEWRCVPLLRDAGEVVA